jgi:hypothetical protein
VNARRRGVAGRAVRGLIVIATAAVIAPFAAAPGVNAADLLLIVAPFIFLVAVRPRVSKTPAGAAASPSAVSASPNAMAPAGSSSDVYATLRDAAAHEAKFNARAERLGFER